MKRILPVFSCFFLAFSKNFHQNTLPYTSAPLEPASQTITIIMRRSDENNKLNMYGRVWVWVSKVFLILLSPFRRHSKLEFIFVSFSFSLRCCYIVTPFFSTIVWNLSTEFFLLVKDFWLFVTVPRYVLFAELVDGGKAITRLFHVACQHQRDRKSGENSEPMNSEFVWLSKYLQGFVFVLISCSSIDILWNGIQKP